VIRPSTITAGVVLVVFVFSNLLSNGFPLRHVERNRFANPDHIEIDPKTLQPIDGPEPPTWDFRAMLANALLGAALALAVAGTASEIERRWSRAQNPSLAPHGGEVVIRTATIAGGLVLIVFVFSNLLSDGFPLRHVERGGMFQRGYFIKVPGPGEKPRKPWTGRDYVPDKWDEAALTKNVLFGAALALAVGIAVSVIERRSQRALELQSNAFPGGES
jgi:hypothetical protein